MVKRKIKKKISTKKPKKDNGWNEYKPMTIVKFENVGDMVIGKFEGFRDGKFGEMIILRDKYDKEIVIPSLATLQNLMNDLKRWMDEHKEIQLSLEYIGDESTENEEYEYKMFDIKTKFID